MDKPPLIALRLFRAVVRRLGHFYQVGRRRSPRDFFYVWLAAVAVLGTALLAMSGLFSAEMQAEMDRTIAVPLPRRTDIERLFSGRDAPPLPKAR